MRNGYDLIIIGGGAAGLTSAIYAGRGRLKTLLIEKLFCGGIASATDLIENYPGYPDGISGSSLMEKFENQAKKWSTEITIEEVKDIEMDGEKKIVKTEKGTYEALSLIITTGNTPKRLGVPGEDRFRGRGVSYCATCDGPLFKDKDIVVVGCGNSGMQEALFLLKFARSIAFVEFLPYIIAEKVLQERVSAYKNVSFYLNHEVLSIEGGNMVESVRIKNRKTGEERDIPAKGVFIYVGFSPETGFLKGKLKMDEQGYIITNENLETSVKGVFAAGDVIRKSLRQIATAVGDGALAAFMAEKYIEGRKS